MSDQDDAVSVNAVGPELQNSNNENSTPDVSWTTHSSASETGTDDDDLLTPLLDVQRSPLIMPAVRDEVQQNTGDNPPTTPQHDYEDIEMIPIVSAKDVPHEDENVAILLKVFQNRPQNEVLEVLHETLMRHDITINDIKDDRGNTLLHLAAEKNYVIIAETLLEHDVKMLVENADGELALEVALEHWRTEFDTMASILVQRLPNVSVRELFGKSKTMSPRLHLHDLIKNKFEKTVSAVLTSLSDVTDDGQTEVYYDILEADDKGELPSDHSDVNFRRKYSAYHCIALEGSINMVNHDTVRLLTSKKWKSFARRRFIAQALAYLLVVFALTFVAVTSASCSDVMTYDTPLQHARAVFEALAYVSVCLKLLSEVRQILREKKRYFSDVVNVIEILASALLVSVLPVRILQTQAHWYVFAVGYLLWIYIIHKYAAIFRTTGIQAEILWRILTTDVVQFSILFAVVNFAFSGCFLLVLKGDDGLQTNDETSSFFSILFLGLRTLIEGGSLLDYTEEYRTISIIVIMLFLFVTIVILLNILIAHLSDTYQRVAADADRFYEVNLARIIAWMEINDWACSGCKTIQDKFYSPSELIDDLKQRLDIRNATMIEEIGQMACMLVRKQNAHDLHVMTVKSEVKRMLGAIGAMFSEEQPAIKRKLEDVKSELVEMRGSVEELKKFPEVVRKCFKELKSDLGAVTGSLENMTSEIEELKRSVYEQYGYGIATRRQYDDDERSVLKQRDKEADDVSYEVHERMLLENIPDLHTWIGTRDELDAVIGQEQWFTYLTELPQHEVLAYLNDHYRKGVKVGEFLFERRETALHIAARRGYYFVVEKLIDVKVDLLTRTEEGKLALQIALEEEKDEVAALLIRRIEKPVARSLFLVTSDGCLPYIKLSDYFKGTFSSFVSAALDSLVDHDTVFYDVLESDEHGHTPDQPEFDRNTSTVFQDLAAWGDKNAINHALVRVLIQRKWYGYARRQFVVYLMLYLASLLCLTFAAVNAAHADDVTNYTTSRDTERAVFEVLTIVFIFLSLMIEVSEMCKNKLAYFRDSFNWLEGGAALILVVMVPVARFTNVHVHWYMFAVGYFLWVLIVFKYAAIFRQSGAYAQILWHIVRHDIVQFSVLFCVINLAFSGSFFLVARGDDNLHVNNETSTFFGIFFVGLRTMTEGEPVVTYIGPDGYRTIGVIVTLVFLFITIVILLNILIAQLSDTYTKIQGDAHRELEVRMAKIIARIEQNPLLPCCKSGRSSSYLASQPTKDVRSTAGVGPDVTEEIYKNVEFVAMKQVTNQSNTLALKDETFKCTDAVKQLKSSTDEQTDETNKVKRKVETLGNQVKYLQEDIQETQGHVSSETKSIHKSIEEVMRGLDKVQDELSKVKRVH